MAAATGNLKEYAAAASTRKAARRQKAHALAARAASGGTEAPDMAILADVTHPEWKAHLAKAMRFAYYERTNKDLRAEAIAWLKGKGVRVTQFADLPDYEFVTLGQILWIENAGGKLDDRTFTWVKEKLVELKEKPRKAAAPRVGRSLGPTEIASRNADSAIQAIDDAIDSWLISGKGPNFKGPRLDSFEPFDNRKVYNHFLAILKEITEAASGKTPELAEGYATYSKIELARLSNFLLGIMKDLAKEKAPQPAKPRVVRKPRARKAVPPAKLVQRLKFKTKDDDLKVTSVRPETFIGADTLYVFNTKYRTLGVYKAADGAGLTIKGQTLQNFDGDKSVAKTVRKPDTVLAQVLAAGKIDSRRILDGIRATEKKLTGRIGPDTILLKVYK